MTTLPPEPMLAHSSKKVAATVEDALASLDRTGLWHFDVKWDGVRMLAVVQDGDVRLFTRLANEATGRYPEVVDALSRLHPRGRLILDGEIVVFGKDGRPSFAGAHKRDAQGSPAAAKILSKTLPAKYMVFDVLEVDEQNLRPLALTWRHERLQQLGLDKHAALGVSTMSPNGATMWAFILEHRLEGLIAKKTNSTYIAGRSMSWVKLKPIRSVTALVKGIEAGDGSRAKTFGALELCVLGEGYKLIDIGKVGSGFTQSDLAKVSELLAQGTSIMVEVEYQEVGQGGLLRFPVFKGLRHDIDILECTYDQLT